MIQYHYLKANFKIIILEKIEIYSVFVYKIQKEKMMKKRLDLILVERELFETREKAKREIMAGNVIVNEQVETKAGTMFMDNDKLKIRIKDKLKYVSRGGLKL